MGFRLGPKRGFRVRVSLGVGSILGFKLGLGLADVRGIPPVP